MGCDISDQEFEAHQDAVYQLWHQRVDTYDIAQQIGISEAKVHWILTCCLEAKFDQMDEAREELAKYPDFDPAAVVSQTSREKFKAMISAALK